MKKSDLRSGDVVELRDGRKQKVYLDSSRGDIISEKSGWGYLSDYKEDLQFSHIPGLDIVAVYRTMNHEFYLPAEKIAILENMIWHREEEPIEISSEEAFKIIAEVKGVDASRIRIKENISTAATDQEMNSETIKI